jgi:hypothetical protein
VEYRNIKMDQLALKEAPQNFLDGDKCHKGNERRYPYKCGLAKQAGLHLSIVPPIH